MNASRRRSIKAVDDDFKKQLRDDCRGIGRQHRQRLLQQSRLLLSTTELQAKLHECTMNAIRSELELSSQEGVLFTDHDIDELLADMQQQVMQEIEEELAAIDRAEQQDQHLAVSMAEDHLQHLQSAGVSAEAVLCPVCRGSHLLQRHGWLVCPAEGWQLNLAAESLQLEDVRQRLATVFGDHASSGCRGQLQFHIEDLFGSHSLTGSCTVCQTLTVVL